MSDGSNRAKASSTSSTRWRGCACVIRVHSCSLPARDGGRFGIVLPEALACEKPIVATRIDGYAALVGNSGCGRLVPPGDAAALAAALDHLLSDDAASRRCGG